MKIMKNIKLLALLVIGLQSIMHAAQESKVQDDPAAIIPFDQYLDQTVAKLPGMNQTFAFLQKQGLENESFRQFLQTRLVRDDEENEEREANFGEIFGKAEDRIAAHMKDQFRIILNNAVKERKSLDQFCDPIFLYVMQYKDDFMQPMVRQWLFEWSKTNDYAGKTPLYNAATYNSTEVARMLINAGADINLQSNGICPLSSAIGNNSLKVARMLIGTDLNIKDNNGYTPLHYVSLKDSAEITRMLIDAGANINVQSNYGETPLFTAACKNSTKVARILINAGANLNLKESNGFTSLFCAAYYNNIAVARILINAGADLNLQNNHGQTVIMTPEMNALFVRARANREAIHNQNSTSCCTIS